MSRLADGYDQTGAELGVDGHYRDVLRGELRYDIVHGCEQGYSWKQEVESGTEARTEIGHASSGGQAEDPARCESDTGP